MAAAPRTHRDSTRRPTAQVRECRHRPSSCVARIATRRKAPRRRPVSAPVVRRTSFVAAATSPAAAKDQRPRGTSGRSATTARNSARPGGTGTYSRRVEVADGSDASCLRARMKRPGVKTSSVRGLTSRSTTVCRVRVRPSMRTRSSLGSPTSFQADNAPRRSFCTNRLTASTCHAYVSPRSAATAVNARSSASGHRFWSTRSPASSRVAAGQPRDAASIRSAASELVRLSQPNPFRYRLVARVRLSR